MEVLSLEKGQGTGLGWAMGMVLEMGMGIILAVGPALGGFQKQEMGKGLNQGPGSGMGAFSDMVTCTGTVTVTVMSTVFVTPMDLVKDESAKHTGRRFMKVQDVMRWYAESTTGTSNPLRRRTSPVEEAYRAAFKPEDEDEDEEEDEEE